MRLKTNVDPRGLVDVKLEALDNCLCSRERLPEDLSLLRLLLVVKVEAVDDVVVGLGLRNQVGIDSLEVALLYLNLVEEFEADG